MSGPKLTLFFDVISPFAYLAFYRATTGPLRAYTTVVPVHIGGIFRSAENKPPITIPLKGKYIFHDLKRQAKMYHVPLVAAGKPTGFPLSTVYAMRVLCVVQQHYSQETLVACASKLFEALWVNDRPLNQEAEVVAAVQGVVGEEAWEKIAGLVTTDGKKVLVENTDAVIKADAFGLPWLVGE